MTTNNTDTTAAATLAQRLHQLTTISRDVPIELERVDAIAIASTLDALVAENARLAAKYETSHEYQRLLWPALREIGDVTGAASMPHVAVRFAVEEVKRLQAENAELREALCSMVAQHCRRRDSEHLDDWALSANEEALDLLARLGDVKEVATAYGRYEWAGRMLPQEPAS